MEGSRILIAIKDFELREKISSILTVGKYKVKETASGSEAVEYIRENPIDLVICGIELIGMDGFGVLRVANKFLETAAISFIMLLEKYQEPLAKKAMELGTDGYIVEPFDDLELLNQAEVRLRKKRFQQEAFLKKSQQARAAATLTEALPWFIERIKDFPLRAFKKNQTIFYNNERVGGLHFIISGRVKTFISDIKGNTMVTGIYHKSQYFGLENLSLGQVSMDEAMAIENTEVITIPLQQLQQMIVDYPGLLQMFIRDLSSRVAQRERRLLETVYCSVRKRISNTIVRLSEDQPYSGQTILTISRNDLASFTGVASETLSRVLGDFDREGIIGKQGNEIIIKRPEQLKSLRS